MSSNTCPDEATLFQDTNVEVELPQQLCTLVVDCGIVVQATTVMNVATCQA